MKWQPIETAPTDGTRILLRGRNGKIADGHYGQPDGFANPKRFVWPYINATPTHWAPLALIAAAAELLAAAIRVNALSIQTDAHKELRAAIANATGDDDAAPECTCAAKDLPTVSRWWDSGMQALEEWQRMFPYNGPSLGD